jgi:hypothetical protein
LLIELAAEDFGLVHAVRGCRPLEVVKDDPGPVHALSPVRPIGDQARG